MIGKKLRQRYLHLRSKPLVWDTLITTGWSTIGKSIGFIVPFFIAAWFGISSQTDAFFFAYGLILFLSGIFAPVVEGLVVPYVAEARSKNVDVGAFVGKILGISGVWLLCGCAVFLLLFKPLIAMITRFDAKSLELINMLLIETSPLFVLLAWTSILSGVLNAYKRFIIPATSPAFRAIINLAVIFIFKDKIGVQAIALGYVAGEVVRLIILLLVIKRLNILKLSIRYTIDNESKVFFKTVSYQTISMVMVGLNPVVDKIMASWLQKGSVSILEYADRLYMIPVTFISSGLMVTLLSHWSSEYYGGGQKKLRNDVIKAVKLVGSIAVVITIFLLIFYQPIVKLAFGRGVFVETKLHEVGLAWIGYLLGFVPYIIGIIFVRAYVIIKNTRILLFFSVWSFLLNIILNYILMQRYNVYGIALSTSITMLVITCGLGFTFIKMVKK